MDDVKLPKQWARWCKKAGLKLSYSSNLRRKYVCFYMTGHGRHWRVNCYGDLDISCPVEDFDRWALSREYSYDNMVSLIQNEQQFVSLVKEMLKSGESNGSSSEV